jgi:hypothetical protein
VWAAAQRPAATVVAITLATTRELRDYREVFSSAYRQRHESVLAHRLPPKAVRTAAAAHADRAKPCHCPPVAGGPDRP